MSFEGVTSVLLVALGVLLALRVAVDWRSTRGPRR
jgi:hypothetical protein